MADDKDNKLGPTGEFPDGKLGADDDGCLRLAVSEDKVNNQVRIDFGTFVAWISMDPVMTRQFGEYIINSANKLTQ